VGGRQWRAREESAREVVKVESGCRPHAPTRGIRTTSPRGTAATGGVRSPPHHACSVVRAHAMTGVSHLSNRGG
jgi:hypothetical protein